MELSKIKLLPVVFISALWFLSITAPPILQLLDDNGQSIAYTLNEEESKEQEKKDNAEEIILYEPQGIRNFLLSLYLEKSGWNTPPAFSNYYQEIQLPPPESLT